MISAFEGSKPLKANKSKRIAATKRGLIELMSLYFSLKIRKLDGDLKGRRGLKIHDSGVLLIANPRLRGGAQIRESGGELVFGFKNLNLPTYLSEVAFYTEVSPSISLTNPQ
jgi:hypothetical protein